MKILTIIFTIYVLTIATIPCFSKYDSCCETINNKEQKAVCCSPFFSCNGCFGFAITKSETFIYIPLIPEIKKYIFKAIPTQTEFHYTIWQPPKTVEISA